ncbi:MAG: CBS domain-containing protein [Anaerolineae bacterium]|nr:CBS domain-containing protein [Anaerolineae bacterium]
MIGQTVLVSDVFDPSHLSSVIVRPDEHLEDVLRRFSEEPALRGIFVCDETGRFLGAITRTDLLYWARLQLGTALHGSSLPPERIVRLAQLVQAATASDVIHPGSRETGVRMDEPLDHALRQMLNHDIVAIPVVDDQGVVLGDLTRARVMRYLLCLSGPRPGPRL